VYDPVVIDVHAVLSWWFGGLESGWKPWC